jgi:ribose transport system permease protein
VGYEFDAIAATVVGGTSMLGGEGSIYKTVMGAIIIGVLGNALNLLNITAYPQMIIKGAIIVASVGLDTWNKRARFRGV